MKINENILQKGIVALIVIAGLLTAFTYLPGSSANVVTFDMHKFLNAQRHVADKLLASKQNEIDVLFMQKEVSRRVKSVIEEIADGAQVMSKQVFVLEGTVPDITDAVLVRLGLPINVSDHNAILIKGIEGAERKWNGWKPNNEAKPSPVEKNESPLDLIP
jgi:hypothetical protein